MSRGRRLGGPSREGPSHLEAVAFSSAQSTRALSTGESEFYAITKAAASAQQLTGVLLALGCLPPAKPGQVQTTVGSDATAGIGIASRQGCGRLKHLEVRWLWAQEAVARKKLMLKKVPTATNGADLATKYLAAPRMRDLLLLLGFILVEPTTAERGQMVERRNAWMDEDDGFYFILFMLSFILFVSGVLCGCGSSWLIFRARARVAPDHVEKVTVEVQVDMDRKEGEGLQERAS